MHSRRCTSYHRPDKHRRADTTHLHIHLHLVLKQNIDYWVQWRRFRVASGGDGIHLATLLVSESFLVWGGGGGQAPKCTDITKHHIHVTYMHERAKRASASETYRPLFSHMVWRYKRQYRTKHWHWENLWINYASERGASELGNFSHFHILNCYFLQYSVGTSDTLSQKHIYFQVSK